MAFWNLAGVPEEAERREGAGGRSRSEPCALIKAGDPVFPVSAVIPWQLPSRTQQMFEMLSPVPPVSPVETSSRAERNVHALMGGAEVTPEPYGWAGASYKDTVKALVHPHTRRRAPGGEPGRLDRCDP